MTRAAALLGCILLLTGAACSKSKNVVITVGDRDFTREEFEARLREHKSGGVSQPTRAAVVTQFVESEILEREAGVMGLKLADAEIDAFMKENAITDKHKATARLFLLRQKVSAGIAADIAPDRAKIEEIKSALPDAEPEKIVFQQILLNKEDAAYKLLDELKKGGVFEDAARQHSLSPEGKRGGTVDYLNAEEIPVELARVLRKMRPGELSGVVKSAYGYHLLKLVELKPFRKLTADEREARARAEAVREAGGDRYADWFARKRKEYKVTVKWEEIEKIN